MFPLPVVGEALVSGVVHREQAGRKEVGHESEQHSLLGDGPIRRGEQVDQNQCTRMSRVTNDSLVLGKRG